MLRPLLAHLGQQFLLLYGGDHGALRVVRARVRRREHGHDAVADELVHESAVFENDVAHRGKVLVELGVDLLGGHRLAHGREAANVAVEDRRLYLLSLERQLRPRVVLLENVPDHRRTDVHPEQFRHDASLRPFDQDAIRRDEHGREDHRDRDVDQVDPNQCVDEEREVHPDVDRGRQ